MQNELVRQENSRVILGWGKLLSPTQSHMIKHSPKPTPQFDCYAR